MARSIPDPLDVVAMRLRCLEDADLSEVEAVEAGRNLAGFIALLARIDGAPSKRGDANECD